MSDNYFIFQSFSMQEYNDKVINQARKTRGYLFKHSSGLISIWQKRYFIIIDNSLCYYADESLQEAKKSINLNDINYIKVVELLEFHLVTKKRIYELKADDEPTRDLWVASLNILINYKEWVKEHSKVQNRSTDKKISGSRPSSKTKKTESFSYSPPSLSKISSLSINGSRARLQEQFSAQLFLQRVCLPRLAQRWRQEQIRNKIILLKQAKSCYFIVSCKTLLHSHQDEDFLSQEFIYPYGFNCLYYYEFGKVENGEVVEICKCSDILGVEEAPKKIMILLQGKTVEIALDYKKMEIVDVLSLVKKIKHAIKIAHQYYNSNNVKIKRNIDRMLYRYDNNEMGLSQIVRREAQKSCGEGREGKGQFRKSLVGLKEGLAEIVDCCEAVGKGAQQFRQKFVREYHDQCYSYVQKMWASLQKVLTLAEQKKVLLLLYDFWKLVRETVKESRLFEVALAVQRNLMLKYREQILSKIDSCFSLKEGQILDEVKIEIKGSSQIIDKLQTVFYSNNIYRQFHVDIRLVLYEFPEMPVHDKVLQEYLGFFALTFRHISEQTFKYLDKWKNANLLLGTCNEIEFIKNSLFQEMYSKMTKEYPAIKKSMRDKYLKDLEAEMSSTEIVLVKNLFVLTFSSLDKGLLSKSFDELNVHSICEQIIDKLKLFGKINKYVRRNIFEASFEQICYFYYTNIIKFHRKHHTKVNTAEFFVKKLTEDIRAIGKYFQSFIYPEKIYTHLKDLSLLKEFVQTDLGQIKKICQHLKKEFGNSFTETAVVNLLSLRDMSEEMRQNLALQCSEIVKHSADTPEQISLMSSNRESFFENWNNSRSRKSTLTLSLNEFYENQYSIHQSKYNCTVWKQGFLLKRKFVKSVASAEVRAFFKINRSQLEEYETENQEEPHTVYELQKVRKCYMHPEKNYSFVLDLQDCKLQFKAETAEEAREWVKHIYDDLTADNRLKESPTEKERNSDNMLEAVKELMKDSSTMDSYQRTMRSLEKSASCSPKINRKQKQEPIVIQEEPLEKPFKSSKQIKAKEDIDDNCLKCSKGFLF